MAQDLEKDLKDFGTIRKEAEEAALELTEDLGKDFKREDYSSKSSSSEQDSNENGDYYGSKEVGGYDYGKDYGEEDTYGSYNINYGDYHYPNNDGNPWERG